MQTHHTVTQLLTYSTCSLSSVTSLAWRPYRACTGHQLEAAERKDVRVKAASASACSDRLRRRQAVIVGGTKGLGAALAVELAGHGARVVIVGRTDSEGVVARMRSAAPKEATAAAAPPPQVKAPPPAPVPL